LAEDSKHIDYLITRYLAGEASEVEKLQIEQWMNESEVNNKYFIDYRYIHDKAVSSNKLIKVDVDKAWNNLHQQMKSVPKTQVIYTAKKSTFRMPIWLQVAASFLLLTGMSFWLYNKYNKSSEQVTNTFTVTSTEKVLKYKLADNSKIVLNKKSKIVYSSQFAKKNRELTLTGEAYFNVRHSSDTPFIVKAEVALIKDIGTSFNVKAYDGAKTIEVYVENGEVLFYASGNPGISLKKGETGIYNKMTKSFNKSGTAELNVLSYKTKHFIFQNINLIEAINQLNAVYPESIRINNNVLINCKITVTFDNEDVATIANVIAETLGLQVLKSPDGFILEGKGCMTPK
jgi:ferric-dicitrate binding protein FerR (iron transport regulator)